MLEKKSKRGLKERSQGQEVKEHLTVHTHSAHTQCTHTVHTQPPSTDVQETGQGPSQEGDLPSSYSLEEPYWGWLVCLEGVWP